MLKIGEQMCVYAQQVRSGCVNLNWNDIRFFLSVSRTKSFVSAAQQLRVTHSTVSRRISALESALGTELFVRTERGCSLTSAGERLLPTAKELEGAAMRFQEHVPASRSELAGTIRVGTPDGLGNCFLAAELNKLQREHPLLEVELVSVPIYYSLSKREVDILITVKKPTARKVVAEKISNYKLGLFAARTYLDNAPPIREVADFKAHRFISYIDDLLYDQRLRFLEELYPAVKTTFRSSTVLGQMNAIKAGAGIGVLPFFMAHNEPDLVQVLPDRSIEREFWAQVNPDSSQFAKMRETLNFIINTIRSKKDLFQTY